MIQRENLLNMTLNFVTPDIIQKFSDILGQSTDKVQLALKSVIPTLLLGIANKGITKEGAENLVDIINAQSFEGTTATTTDYADENYLKSGRNTVHQIFDSDLNSVVSQLGISTGMNRPLISKMMGMTAPIVMGVLATKIRRDSLSPSGLMGFLAQQKTFIKNFIPEGLLGKFSSIATGTTNGIGTSALPRHHNRISWTKLTFLALAVLAVLWWFTGKKAMQDVSTPATTDESLSP